VPRFTAPTVDRKVPRYHRTIDLAGFNRLEEAGWGRAGKARDYDGFFGHITRRAAAALLDAARVRAGARVLDVATGPGYAAAEAAARGADVVGVDRSADMLALARELNPGIEFTLAPAEGLPFEDGSFDAVVAGFLILHVADPDATALELARVLRPGGSLALSMWDDPARMRVLGLGLEALQAAGEPVEDRLPLGPPLARFMDAAALGVLLEQSGLDDVAVERHGFDHTAASAAEAWDGSVAGTVRLAALVEAQPPEALEAVRGAYERSLTSYRTADGYALPVSYLVAAGRQPPTAAA
jgi:SAM-dependent methyltransferase